MQIIGQLGKGYGKRERLREKRRVMAGGNGHGRREGVV